jgi:23S rRNA pseudouridine2605 synthase
MLTRLQKIISDAGVTSRRKAEFLIQEGRVRVNGKVITQLGSKADPERDEIHVNGNRIEPQQQRIVLLLYKPDGYITSLRDPEGRPTVTKLVDEVPVRLYPIGRLDYHTEGLLLLTNDGQLAQRIEHPSHAIDKVYTAKVKGIPETNVLMKLRKGILLEGRKTLPAKIAVLETRKNAWLKITIREGRQNQIRKMFEFVGHPVIKLRREAIAFLDIRGMKPGEFRFLAGDEIQKLYRLGENRTPKKRS